jgi:hypothetical protein
LTLIVVVMVRLKKKRTKDREQLNIPYA